MSDDLFNQGSVRVTRTMLFIGQKSYPVNGITALNIEQAPINKDANKTLGVGALVTLGGLWGLFQSGGIGWIFLIVVGIAAFGAGLKMMQRPWFLQVSTAGLNHQELKGDDQQRLTAIKAAIESAIAHRG